MQLFQIVFALLLLMTTGYAAVFGGRTGKAGAAIFWGAALLTMVAGDASPLWNSTIIGVMLADIGCMLALGVLASVSNRHWPIWAFGFQIVAVLTHVTTIVAPEFFPRAYYWMTGFWSLPILFSMVAGTRLDRMRETLRRK